MLDILYVWILRSGALKRTRSCKTAQLRTLITTVMSDFKVRWVVSNYATYISALPVPRCRKLQQDRYSVDLSCRQYVLRTPPPNTWKWIRLAVEAHALGIVKVESYVPAIWLLLLPWRSRQVWRRGSIIFHGSHKFLVGHSRFYLALSWYMQMYELFELVVTSECYMRVMLIMRD